MLITGPRFALGFLASIGCVFLAASTVIATTDLDIDADTGEVIDEIKNVVSDFELSNVPADLEVEAESMTFDYEGGKLVYKGDVEVIHGTVNMSSDELLLSFDVGKKKSLQSVAAKGNVTVIRGTEKATGESAIYNPSKGTIVLKGNAKLGSGPNLVSGDSVTVYLIEGRAVVNSGKTAGRVKAYIDPNSFDRSSIGDLGEFSSPTEQGSEGASD